MYAAKAMTLPRMDTSALLIFESKILRTILGSVKVNDNEYSKMMNFEDGKYDKRNKGMATRREEGKRKTPIEMGRPGMNRRRSNQHIYKIY